MFKENYFFYSEQYEGIYEVLNQYSIRSITFNGLNETIAEQIIKLRPMPSNFVIFAHPSEMTNILENVITNFFILLLTSLKYKLKFVGNYIQSDGTFESLAFVFFGFR